MRKVPTAINRSIVLASQTPLRHHGALAEHSHVAAESKEVAEQIAETLGRAALEAEDRRIFGVHSELTLVCL
jgi:hypothetical protein